MSYEVWHVVRRASWHDKVLLPGAEYHPLHRAVSVSGAARAAIMEAVPKLQWGGDAAKRLSVQLRRLQFQGLVFGFRILGEQEFRE